MEKQNPKALTPEQYQALPEASKHCYRFVKSAFSDSPDFYTPVLISLEEAERILNEIIHDQRERLKSAKQWADCEEMIMYNNSIEKLTEAITKLQEIAK